jgi:hypothetical protein
MKSLVAAVAAVLVTVALSSAAEQTILGKQMLVKDPLPGVNPSKRVFAMKAYEKLSTNTVVGDPLANGATVQVIVNGGSSTSQAFLLPAGPPPISTGPGWIIKSKPGVAYLKYTDKNGEASAITQLTIKQYTGRYFSILVKGSAQGNNGPIDVVPANPTTDLGMIITLGGGDSYCVLFGGAAGGAVSENGEGTTVKAVKPTGEGCPVAAP